MIIHLDIDLSSLDPDSATFQDTLSELIRSHRRGNHLLIIRRQLVNDLLGLGILGAADRAMLTQIASDYAQSGDLLRSSEKYVRVVSQIDENIRETGRAIEINFSSIARKNLLDKSVLLVEDTVSDGAFYTWVINNIVDVYNIPKVSFTVQHGGGERTAAVLKKEIEDGRIICTIVDTDKYAPSERVAKKTDQLNKIIKDENWPFAKVFSFFCREVENMVPVEVIRFLPCSVERKFELSILLNLQTNIESKNIIPRLWHYLDIKNGIDHQQLSDIKDESDKSWLVQKIKDAGLNDQSFEVRGFGTHVIPQLMSDNAALNELRSIIRSSPWTCFFGEAIAKFAWMGVCPRRQFV
ncbi:hypothetical protein [Methylobacterium thuringiense]|uniref:DUF4435 domain-containing protein n=1 Tax=Methylobacterium thuringiense TaxID=1003091 RepID=A0ABQ4TFY9_9HYPH|nr:hypothetical protein [Methylobacterium thuringiense]GJE53682.1 hypothetical protein EKPJFOCH_0148 [Methylobacterium thuringiense]